MAVRKSLTRGDGRATFLLEVALDRARMKERFAAWLLAERANRGGGDPRRFPQPKMAELVGIGLRQYQRWEDADDPSLPTWANIEAIARLLDADVSELFTEPPTVEVHGEADGDLEEMIRRTVVEVLHEVQFPRLEALEAQVARRAATVDTGLQALEAAIERLAEQLSLREQHRGSGGGSPE